MKINEIRERLNKMMELSGCDETTCRDIQNIIRDLEHIVKETLWMARRYADGRSTYAPGLVNECIDLAIKLEIDLHGPPEELYAKDGLLREWDRERGEFKNEKG